MSSLTPNLNLDLTKNSQANRPLRARVAGSNPALRTFFDIGNNYLLTGLLTKAYYIQWIVDKSANLLTTTRKLLTRQLKLSKL